MTNFVDCVNISIVKNIFGDIIGIYYGNTCVAKYKYDAWGNCTVENFPLEGTDEDFLIGNINPFRYRGYYWCEALQMYHLQTRWYDPTIGRFISPDSYEYLDPETIGGLNLYSYCLNNPIMYVDPTGHSAIVIGLIIGAIVGAGVGFGTAAYIDYKDDGQIFNGSVAWYDYLGATILGCAIGAGVGAGLGAFASMSFPLSIPTYGWVNAGGVLLFEKVGEMAVTITGAQILEGVGILSGIGILASIIGKSGGYIVKKFSNDHDPAHVHIYGDDIGDKAHGIRIGQDGNPLPGQEKLPPGARKALKKLWKLILKSFLK